MGAIGFEKSASPRPGWPIIRNALLPSRLKNTDLGALGFGKTPLYRPARAFFQNLLLPGNFIGHNMAAPRIPGSADAAAGIYDLRRLKIKHCSAPVGKARSVPDFCLPITQYVQVPRNLNKL